MILNDKQIKELAEKEEMISPFVSEVYLKALVTDLTHLAMT